jgi:hypothetical protein
MGRLIGGVAFGYFAMTFTLFIALTIAYLVVGADRAFGAGVYQVTLFWAVLSFIVGFAAAVLGGRVARAFSGRPAGPQWLAVIVFVIGTGVALMIVLGGQDGGAARTDLVGPFQAMRAAQTPLWIALVNPFIGAAGVLLGGGVFARRGAERSVHR